MKSLHSISWSVLLSLFSLNNTLWSQDEPELKSIDEVIQGIDSLLGDMDKSRSTPTPRIPTIEKAGEDEIDRSFRLGNELMPDIFLDEESVDSLDLNAVNEDDLGMPADSAMNPTLRPILETKPPVSLLPPVQSQPLGISPQQIKSLPKLDYTQASLEDLMREVDLLELPEFQMQLRVPTKSVVTPINIPTSDKPVELIDTGDVISSPILSDVSMEEIVPSNEDFESYTVLGDQIDEEMKGKIREAIMETRMASGGTGNPYVTRSVHKATAFCNRVLGRLNAPNHKRYRRDILLSLISMHEKNQQWVDAAKSYERFLEEFAADDSYPFEEHEDAPGIPDLYARVGSLRKWLESLERGAPTIPETHIRTGKIYRTLGAHRMALNKFYDSINATLTLPKNEAFELAERRKGNALERRSDAESNRAMFEIAETFMDSEDYDNAIKFFDRLWRLEQLEDTDRAIVRFKQGLAHYRRARENLRKEERINRLPPEEQEKYELKFDQTPRADFAKVKETLRGYGTLYPQSPYIPESHYLLALTFEQLNQDEDSIAQLLVLLKEADFNPDLIIDLEQGRTQRDQDITAIRRMKSVWAFWKKKTGNYLANKFFEDSEFFNAYRIYTALREIDPSPSWQIPVLYQIALCEEKLGNYVQAMETYSSIEEFVNSDGAREGLANSKYLEFVFGMAKWRREQLEDTRAIRQAVNRYGIYTLPSNSQDSSVSAINE